MFSTPTKPERSDKPHKHAGGKGKRTSAADIPVVGKGARAYEPKLCERGCGRQAFGTYPTCCTHCMGPDGPHARDCDARHAKGKGAKGKGGDSKAGKGGDGKG